VLKSLFPRYELHYTPTIIPDTKGETIDALHDRTAYALHRIIERCDAEGVKAIVICSHAATLYAIGRALTGRMPADVAEEDFRTFTCGLSRFVRRRSGARDGSAQEVEVWRGPSYPPPKIAWRGGNGVGGGWECVLNGDCSFLSGGEERGWRFSGDESFLSSSNAVGMDAGAGLGVVVEGRKGKGGPGAGKGARL
jgi:transcription factor C subunit 7